jgi:hypothetical protein
MHQANVNHDDEDHTLLELVVSFRGSKTETVLRRAGEMSVEQLKQFVIESYTAKNVNIDPHVSLTSSDDKYTSVVSPSDIKLLYNGKKLIDSQLDVYTLLMQGGKEKRKRKVCNLIALGMSVNDQRQINEDLQAGISNSSKSRLVRDDLTEQGKLELLEKNLCGQQRLAAATAKHLSRQHDHRFGFQRIETLPFLPNQDTATDILSSLSNDAGIRACMEKHHWTVGCLAEMYPEGNVGQSPVCVMGLNQNKGQKILLRLRTDDLRGFRKILSVRKVLYHELAHNVHTNHDTPFYQLMRQVEEECTSSVYNTSSPSATAPSSILTFAGGSGRLGGDDIVLQDNTIPVPVRELAARAALLRLSLEEQEICQHCGSFGQSSGISAECHNQVEHMQETDTT